MTTSQPTEIASAVEAWRSIAIRYSVVVPVYGNEGSIPLLLGRLGELTTKLSGGALEVVFVVDGSPDGSAALLRELLPRQPYASALVLHSRNFGSFAAIRTGLERARGEYTGVMAADLQEPPVLMVDFFEKLESGEADLVVGARRTRSDPVLHRLAARSFWALYRRLVQREMPVGGVDVFACTKVFRRRLLELEETNTSLVAQTLWLGFRRATVEYDRQPRDPEHGPSGWTLRKKLKYLSDSVFSFTDLPIRLLLAAGCVGIVGSLGLAALVVAARLAGVIDVPGYAATIVVIAFFAALNLAGLGVIGSYVWRAFENTKRRPVSVVMDEQTFEPRGGP
jgi:glycosyltransferase involved in cell wall biosynthesis